MADRKFSMDEYIDVAERLQDFKDTHPDGSLQQHAAPYVITVEGFDEKGGKDKQGTYVVYTAAAYRTADDPRPGIGTAWEPWPGQTNYTRNSELMNAETAAWGRAIVALGLAANRKLASRQEVRARVEEQAATSGESEAPPPSKASKPLPAARVAELRSLVKTAEWDARTLAWALFAVGVQDLDADKPEEVDFRIVLPALTSEQADALKSALDKAIAGESE